MVQLGRLFRAVVRTPVVGGGCVLAGLGSVGAGSAAAAENWPWEKTHLELPQAVLGILPALLVWIGLVWAQYPLDRAMREQGILIDLENDLPVREPPTLLQSIGSVMRLQVAVTLLPVSLILVVRDLTTVAIWAMGLGDPHGLENWVILPATMCIFVFAPELLRRVLKSEPLPASPLRSRLEAMCKEAGLKYRNIMLWHTDGMMGNASVMGLIPRVRYILLSDLLLETMNERQVEAVFAHELGHVVHRHFLWYGVFGAMIMGFVAGPGDMLLTHLRGWLIDWATVHQWVRPEQHWNELEGLIAVAISMGSFLLAFRYLSPRFERQADVFAARTMQRIAPRPVELSTPLPAPADLTEAAPMIATSLPPVLTYAPRKTYVGEYGAGVFASALHRVAVINRTPVSAGSVWHGSIADRMRYLHEISSDPAHTYRFDRVMNRLYATLLVALCTFGTWGRCTARATPPVPRPACRWSRRAYGNRHSAIDSAYIVVVKRDFRSARANAHSHEWIVACALDGAEQPTALGVIRRSLGLPEGVERGLGVGQGLSGFGHAGVLLQGSGSQQAQFPTGGQPGLTRFDALRAGGGVVFLLFRLFYRFQGEDVLRRLLEPRVAAGGGFVQMLLGVVDAGLGELERQFVGPHPNTVGDG